MKRTLMFAMLLLPSLAWGQLVPGTGIDLQDEGIAQGRIRTLNCTGTGLVCSRAGLVGTIDGSGGAAGAPTAYAYWGSGADATLSAEINLAALSTGLVLNTAGAPSAYAGTTCTNQVIRLLSASGAATCQTITSAYVDTSIWTGTATSGLLKASSQGVLTQAISGTDYAPASHSHVDADIPNNITIDLATVATTAGALSANGANCIGNTFALGVDASGVAECAQPAFSNLSGSATDAQVPNTITLDNLTQITTRAISDTTGTLAVGRGGTGQTTLTTNQVYIGTALDTLTAKTLPSCSNTTTSKLLYNNSTQEFSCGTDQTGGGGSLTISTTEIDFGTTAKFVATATVTDAGVSGASKILTWQSGAAATGRQADENEMDAITCNANPGTGSFTLRCHTERTVTHGLFPVFYTVQ